MIFIANNHDLCVFESLRLHVDGDMISLRRPVLEVIEADDTQRPYIMFRSWFGTNIPSKHFVSIQG